MHLNVRVTRSSLQDFATLEYNLSHTSEDMAASVMRTFQHIYAQFVNASDRLLLQDVEVCSELDQAITKRFTQMDSTPTDCCVHDLVLKQCRMRPNETAVRSWDGDLTYKELDDLSLRLARYLVQLGVGPEIFVLSCFIKSTWAIVARLAVLRAGGAYISINASNPPIYLQSVITRTKTEILLTDPHYAHQFRNAVSTVVELSLEFLQNLSTGDDSKVCDTVQSDNACLVLFTSGSTGTPKGIIQTHKAYATAIQNYARDLGLGAHTRYLHFDDYAFDISNLEFLVPLILGGCCCVPKAFGTIHELVLQINTLNANAAFITPTVAIKINPSDVPCLQNLCVGGEAVPKDLVAKWESSSTRLINQYGMGEAAICCALNTNIDPADGAKIGRPSIGTIWLVDPSSPEKLMPMGAIGEIMIEGPHLSRGYLDQAVLQHSNVGFLTQTPQWMLSMHPNRSSARIYRSGDLGRRNPDGTITHLGRKDTILKVDGCRVEALAVEHQARKCLSDQDTIVVDLLGIINGKEDPSLTAFLYFEEHPNSTAAMVNGAPLLKDATSDPFAADKLEGIKTSIAQSLPRYMIPTQFILMTWVPRTGSKKIDRKKIHMLGQAFHLSQLEQRTKHISYAQSLDAIPTYH
jgi:amino acid adenylation domain-containing protein